MLPRLKRITSLDGLVTGASIVFGVVTAGSVLLRSYTLVIALMLLGGAAWIVVHSSLNVAARLVVPSWVQARSLSIYLLVSQGGTALGSLAWGALAGRVGTSAALVSAGIGLIAGCAVVFVFPLRGGASPDLKPARDWPEPDLAGGLDRDSGPAFVTVEYRVESPHVNEFLRAMAEMQRIRRRDGAVQWGLFVDATDPHRFLEEFVVESWTEHLRQHERVTVSDLQIQKRVRSLHMGPEPPLVTHYISPGRSENPPGHSRA